MSNVLTFPLGPAEAILNGIGEELNELAGLRVTRLAAPASEGATTVTVETTFSWPAAGRFYLDGQLYTYASKTPSTFAGLSPAILALQRSYTTLVDWSRSHSALDLARHSVLVDYAEAEFLDALGRNYGVFRFKGLDDTAFRSAVKALAFAPKGTIQTIMTVLDYLVGPGNYEVFEDLVNFPNVVFISIDISLTAGTSLGKTFFNAREEQQALTTTQVQTTYDPVGGDTDNVLSIQLAPELHTAAFDVGPSAEPDTPWTYTGAEVEATVVTPNGDGSFRLRDTAGAAIGARYERTLRATANTDVYALATMRRVTATDNLALQLRLGDGSRLICVGWNATQVFFYDVIGAVIIGSPVALDTNAHTYELRKRGGANGPTALVELWIDGVKALEAAYTAFSVTATRVAQFGSFSSAGTMDSHWSGLEVYTSDRHVNYWNHRRFGDGSVLTANPARLPSAGSFFDTLYSAARPVVVRGGTVAHGRNNGRYRITAVEMTGAYVDVEGLTHTGLEIIADDTVRVPDGHYDGFTAEDAGVVAARTTGAGAAGLVWTARYGGADGNAISVTIVDPAAPSVPLQVTVVGPAITVTLGTNGGGTVISTAAQVKAAVDGSVSASALVETTLVAAPGASPMVAAGAANLTGGEDGKFLTIAGSSTLANNGTRLISTLIDERTARLGSHVTPAAMTIDAGPLTWRKDPNFSTEAALEWEVVGAGVVTGNTLDFQTVLYASGVQLEVRYLTVRSGFILENEFVVNDGTLFPFYLADPYAYVRSIIDAITVAGVIPRYR